MRPILLLLIPLALGACQPIGVEGSAAQGVVVPEGEVRVVEARANASRVTLRLSDGSRCVGMRPEGVPGGWSGVTGDCGYALPYSVVFRPGGDDPARFRIEAPTLPLGPDGRPGPRAEIFVIDVDGVRRLFTAPLGRNVRFEPAPAT